MVARVNISMPDELAGRIRAAGLPVSQICQRALEAELGQVRLVVSGRQAALLLGLCCGTAAVDEITEEEFSDLADRLTAACREAS